MRRIPEVVTHAKGWPFIPLRSRDSHLPLGGRQSQMPTAGNSPDANSGERGSESTLAVDGPMTCAISSRRSKASRSMPKPDHPWGSSIGIAPNAQGNIHKSIYLQLLPIIARRAFRER